MRGSGRIAMLQISVGFSVCISLGPWQTASGVLELKLMGDCCVVQDSVTECEGRGLPPKQLWRMTTVGSFPHRFFVHLRGASGQLELSHSSMSNLGAHVGTQQDGVLPCRCTWPLTAPLRLSGFPGNQDPAARVALVVALGEAFRHCSNGWVKSERVHTSASLPSGLATVQLSTLAWYRSLEPLL